MCVARPGSDRPLVGQAAACGATLPETLDGPSLDSSTTGHRALCGRAKGINREQAMKRPSAQRKEQKREMVEETRNR